MKILKFDYAEYVAGGGEGKMGEEGSGLGTEWFRKEGRETPNKMGR